MLPDYLTTAFESEFVTWTDEPVAEQGEQFPEETIGYQLDLRFVMTGTGNTYAVLLGAEVRASLAGDVDQAPRRR